MTCCCKKSITSSYSGPDMTFNPDEFLSQHVSAPRGTWGSATNNGFLLHTFNFELEKNCSITSGQLEVDVVRGTGNTVNDELWITQNGGQLAQHDWIWGNNGQAGGDVSNGGLQSRTIVLQLNNESLASATNGSLSFLVEDDTTVNSAKLTLEVCCISVELEAINYCESIVVQTEPWGEVEMPVYGTDKKVIICTEDTCNETSYFVSLAEFDPVAWQDITEVWSGWVCNNCEVPPLIDVSNYLPTHHQSATGGFKSGTYYSFKVAIAEPWTESFIHFKIA